MTLIVILSLLGAPEPASAERLHTVAKDVTSHADFGEEKVILVWQPKKREELDERRDPRRFTFGGQLAGFLARILAWSLGLAGVIALIVLVISVLRARRRSELEEAARKPAPPETLFGLDLRPESLPANVIAAAREAWSRGERQLALSFLYRGALMLVLVREGLEVPASATEGECVALVEARFGSSLGSDFEALTRAWLLTAYGQRPPSEDGFLGLLERWRPRFGGGGT